MLTHSSLCTGPITSVGFISSRRAKTRLQFQRQCKPPNRSMEGGCRVPLSQHLTNRGCYQSFHLVPNLIGNK